MNTLFPLQPAYPEGFQYLDNFISPEEETALLQTVAAMILHAFHFQGYEAKRKVASFGYDWSFEKQQLSKGNEIPPDFNWLITRVAASCALQPADFVELLVTEYPAGAVINWHRDAPPFELLAGISLQADCTFKLRPYTNEKRDRKSVLSFPIRRRSLYIMQGESRLLWQHSTAPVLFTRFSITLRTLKKGIAKSNTPGICGE